MDSSREKDKKRSVFDVHAKVKHAKKRRTIKDLVYGRNVVNLKSGFRARHPWVWVSAIILIIGGGFFGLRHIFTKADVQDFYPSACLGNWQNSANAENHPETSGSPNITFSATNSAVYNSGTQIFCGGFLPTNVATSGHIVNVGLTLVWQIGQPVISTASNAIIAPTNSSDATDSTPTDIASTTNTTSDPESAPAPDPTSATPATPAASSDDGTSFLRELLPFAYAQDDSSSQTLSSATSDDSSTIILGPPIMATLGTASSDTTGTPAIVPPPAPDNNFLDVSYSTDGQTWVSIGEVNINNWPQLTVTLPISNWTDLQNLQIRVEGIATTQDPIPPVYLDGMLLEVHDDTTALPNPILTATSTDQDTSSSAIVSPAGSRMTIVNSAAQQTCNVQPFSQILPLGGTADFTVNLHPSINGVSYNLLTGHLPAGISAGFSAPSGAIAATSSITFQAETSTIPGSLNIVVIYQEQQSDGSTLSNFCQLNINVK